VTRRRLLLWILSLLLAGVFLYFFLRGAHLGRVLEYAREATWPLLVAAVAFEVASIVLRAYRWGVLLRPSAGRKIRMAPLLKATTVSFAITGVMPGRVGEIAKPLLLARWEGLSFAALAGSVVLERVLDLFAIVALWAVYVFFGGRGLGPEAQRVATDVNRVSYVLILIMVAVGFFAWWLAPRRKLLDRWTRRHHALERYPFVRKLLSLFFKFSEGLESFRRKRTILYLLFLSIATWGAVVASAWLLLEALHLQLPWEASILLLVFISIGAAVPTPGGIGGVHKAIAWALTAFYGVDEDYAVAAGFLGHAVLFFPSIIWGIGYIVLGRVHIGEIRAAAEESEVKKTGS
jgi:uncharacterized protein (TIRG00374 family)